MPSFITSSPMKVRSSTIQAAALMPNITPAAVASRSIDYPGDSQRQPSDDADTKEEDDDVETVKGFVMFNLSFTK